MRPASGDNTITDILADYAIPSPGDVFFLPAGRVHAIGAGSFIAEIQQTSNITYRIYDYGRVGADGKPRELHTELAKEAIDYTVLPDYRTHYTPARDTRVELVSCPYFTTSLFDLTREQTLDLSTLDSFVVVMCLEGHGTLTRPRRDDARPSGRNSPAAGNDAHAALYARGFDEAAHKLDCLMEGPVQTIQKEERRSSSLRLFFVAAAPPTRSTRPFSRFHDHKKRGLARDAGQPLFISDNVRLFERRAVIGVLSRFYKNAIIIVRTAKRRCLDGNSLSSLIIDIAVRTAKYAISHIGSNRSRTNHILRTADHDTESSRIGSTSYSGIRIIEIVGQAGEPGTTVYNQYGGLSAIGQRLITVLWSNLNIRFANTLPLPLNNVLDFSCGAM